ncbi:2,3-bisphosphoglycerate-independent phosphoglycerate mutase [Candidatus Woesearchaeota archaeon]|nr:2,3-bisphosphoglycerate-independent phosphoglycerate mutase [Candidatus Woesearchaeota archaeon]
MKQVKGPVVLIIRDGWGISKEVEGNAVSQADTPVHDVLLEQCPHSILKASGEDVGLPKGFQGNSEVGHINIGAGRVVRQMLKKINDEIEDGSFERNKALLAAVENCKQNNSTLHIAGLLQDEGVHAMNTHLYALLHLALIHNLPKVKIHVFSDGRDTPPKSVKQFIDELQEKIKKLESPATIATVCGRYYAMDRDNRWERTEKAYNCLVSGDGRKAQTAKHAVEMAYENKETDEFISPTAVAGYAGMMDNDSFILFNYRFDRSRQISHALVDPEFNNFVRKKKNILFVPFTDYYSQLNKFPNVHVAYHVDRLKNILGEVISKNNLKQLRIAETEKYAHVTFFFNDENEEPFPGEDRILVPSPDVATYDETPEMSAEEITDNLLEVMHKYDVVILNYANPDMVAHTGNFDATVKAIEVVDKSVGKVLEKIKELEGCALITADHGNAEYMQDNQGNILTQHSKYPVDFIVYNFYKCKAKDGKLCDIAPSMLFLLGIEQPKEMIGENLIVKK